MIYLFVGGWITIMIALAVLAVYLETKRSIPHQAVDYSHWDIQLLARVMDPKPWAEFDAVREGKKYYGSYPELKPSFNMAVNALIAGYRLEGGSWLLNDQEVQDHLAELTAEGKVRS
jgi:hypothetical protein